MTFGSLGYGPQARSVLHCHGVLALRGGPWPRAAQDVKVGRQSQGLELEKARFLGSSESDVWQFGLRAAGPVRPSLPWCFGPARGSLARSCADDESLAGKVKAWS